MDLVADMLLQSLRADHAAEVNAVELRPRIRWRLTDRRAFETSAWARNAQRLVSRFVEYPAWLKGPAPRASIYHLVDHSYAHLVHALPRRRTIVTCHDLDTFRSVLDPDAEPRSWPFRAMTRRILSGLQQAERVTCDSIATRDAILAHGLLPAERLDLVYLGVDPIMSPEPDALADQFVARRIGEPDGSTFDVLHVGSTIPRKRIDLLLRIFAAVRASSPRTRLLRVGGPFTAAQQALIRDLDIDPAALVTLPYLDRAQLAAVYRRASLVVQPSEAEGFGLPVVEAMACGVPVVASDLPVLREVGGSAAEYRGVGQVAEWSGTVCAMVRERDELPALWQERRERALAQAAKFSWSRFAERLVEIYHSVAAASRP